MTKEDTGFRHFPTLKGSPDYWRKTQHDLFAMIRQLGIPTFFCSFSCNNDWPEIVTAIKAQQGENVDVTTLSWEEKCNILASNPVTCARMFDHRVKLFLSRVMYALQLIQLVKLLIGSTVLNGRQEEVHIYTACFG